MRFHVVMVTANLTLGEMQWQSAKPSHPEGLASPLDSP